ncbi:hypothetical protein RIF29_09879 [Crotalaria pallida]|uniref:Uncharacterized protein n=1 Tax=Crotalaria pallida TaxID=3830 RepID=A0AAN9FYH6_CROPI
MSPQTKNTTLVDDDDGGGVQYSLALEYNGLAPVYDLPQAAPISVNNIPVATVAPEQVPFSNVFAVFESMYSMDLRACIQWIQVRVKAMLYIKVCIREGLWCFLEEEIISSFYVSKTNWMELQSKLA